MPIKYSQKEDIEKQNLLHKETMDEKENSNNPKEHENIVANSNGFNCKILDTNDDSISKCENRKHKVEKINFEVSTLHDNPDLRVHKNHLDYFIDIDSSKDPTAQVPLSKPTLLNMADALVQNKENNIQKEQLINQTSPSFSFDSISTSETLCRVCQCGKEEESLISPCNCSGSVKWIHESCLVQWMKSSFKDSCELCLTKIEITKRVKPFTKWKLPSRRPTPVVWVLVFVTAIALNLASIVKDASQLCSTTPCLVFYAVGCMGIILGTLFLIFWTKRARNFFNHWLEQNEEWVIVLNDERKDRTSSSGVISI